MRENVFKEKNCNFSFNENKSKNVTDCLFHSMFISPWFLFDHAGVNFFPQETGHNTQMCRFHTVKTRRHGLTQEAGLQVVAPNGLEKRHIPNRFWFIHFLNCSSPSYHLALLNSSCCFHSPRAFLLFLIYFQLSNSTNNPSFCPNR